MTIPLVLYYTGDLDTIEQYHNKFQELVYIESFHRDSWIEILSEAYRVQDVQVH